MDTMKPLGSASFLTVNYDDTGEVLVDFDVDTLETIPVGVGAVAVTTRLSLGVYQTIVTDMEGEDGVSIGAVVSGEISGTRVHNTQQFRVELGKLTPEAANALADRILSRSLAMVEASEDSNGKNQFSAAAGIMRLTGNQTTVQGADGQTYVVIPAATEGGSPYAMILLVLNSNNVVCGTKPVKSTSFCPTCRTIPCCC